MSNVLTPTAIAHCILADLYPGRVWDTDDFADAVADLSDAVELDELSAWTVIEIDGDDWYIVDENDRESMWDDCLQSYLDECVYPQLSEQWAPYFDEERWKRDARMDGAGHAISSYDGCEHEIHLPDGTWLYAYRC